MTEQTTAAPAWAWSAPGDTPNEGDTRFTIGGRAYDVPPINFFWMKPIWEKLIPLIGMKRADPAAMLLSIETVVATVAIGLAQKRALAIMDAEEMGEPLDPPPPQAPSAKSLEMRLKPTEMGAVSEGIFDLLTASGMRPEEGEWAPAGESALAEGASPSTETSTGSLPSSSPPDAKAGAGEQ